MRIEHLAFSSSTGYHAALQTKRPRVFITSVSRTWHTSRPAQQLVATRRFVVSRPRNCSIVQLRASADAPESRTRSFPTDVRTDSVPPPPLQDAKFTFWIAAAAEACAALLAITLCKASGLPALGKGWAIDGEHLIRAVAAVVPFSAVFWALERAPTGIQAATEASFRAFFGARSVWEIGVFCLCVAFGEELLFRSWLLAGLESWSLPPHFALVSSSVVFGMLHAYTRMYMVLASFAGFWFGYMFLASGQSILEPLVVHFLYDFCTILVMQRKWLHGEE